MADYNDYLTQAQEIYNRDIENKYPGVTLNTTAMQRSIASDLASRADQIQATDQTYTDLYQQAKQQALLRRGASDTTGFTGGQAAGYQADLSAAEIQALGQIGTARQQAVGAIANQPVDYFANYIQEMQGLTTAQALEDQLGISTTAGQLTDNPELFGGPGDPQYDLMRETAKTLGSDKEGRNFRETNAFFEYYNGTSEEDDDKYNPFIDSGNSFTQDLAKNGGQVEKIEKTDWDARKGGINDRYTITTANGSATVQGAVLAMAIASGQIKNADPEIVKELLNYEGNFVTNLLAPNTSLDIGGVSGNRFDAALRALMNYAVNNGLAEWNTENKNIKWL